MTKKKIANNLFDFFFEVEDTSSKTMNINLTTNNLPSVTFNADNINHYTQLNLQRVCTIHSSKYSNDWVYKNINHSLMYSSHRSWVYGLTVNDIIVKIGETGQPLGIAYKRGYSDQPITGTESRFGRYARHKKAANTHLADTDEFIRESLWKETSSSDFTVAFYVYKCEEVDIVTGIEVYNLFTVQY